MRKFITGCKPFVFSIIFIISVPVLAQEKDSLVNVFLETDIGFASSTNDGRKQSNAGVGTLGIRFEQGEMFGHANFTVYSQNEEITTSDPDEYKLFGTNMLLPENNSGNISNFSFLLGTESFTGSFFKKRVSVKQKPFYSLRKIGLYGYFSANNTNWSKDSLSVPIAINSFGINISYTLLDLMLINESKERIKLIMFVGLTARRLGGDYAMDSNSELRKQFIGTDKIGFNGTILGSRLEVGKFYGEIGVPWFARKDNIAGFSGNQPFISLGVKADLNLSARPLN